MSPETKEAVEEFCRKSAEAMDITLMELKSQASEDLDAFWAEFEKWNDKREKPSETVVEVDEDMEKIHAGILGESLEKLKKFPEYAVAACRLNAKLKVGEMPTTVDEANELIDACKKFLFQNPTVSS